LIFIKKISQRPSIVPLGSLESLIKERQILQTKVDFLSAEREISLVLSENVEFKSILEKVLYITADLFGTTKTGEVALYLKDGHSGKLKLRALQKEGQILFDSEDPKDPLIEATHLHRRPFLTSTQERLNIIVPLSADKVALGVMKISVRLEGDFQERIYKTEAISQNLDEFAKIISLAIKTPDLYIRAVEDSLTGLATKRHFTTELQRYFETAKRYNEPLSLIMIDIDHFKKINDTYGHQAGDIVLKGVASVIRKNTRRLVDSAYSGYRFGGEELSVILPKSDIHSAYKVAERLRKHVQERTFHIGAKEIKVTISLGVACIDKNVKTPGDLISRADDALYIAKKRGRNRTCISQ
jgi:diguanylate cyclase (GGDEF)-like protein